MHMMSLRPYAAEFLGTLTLTLIVNLSASSWLINLGIPTAYMAGLALGLSVYTIGWISGSHLNPAVSIALGVIKKLPVQDVVYYVLAQLLGAVGGWALATYLGGNVFELTTPNTAHVTIVEAIGAFVLLWGIMSVVEGKVSKGASGLVIGGSLTLGVLIAMGMGSNGILNPAVALGLHTFTLSNIVGPVIGAIAAAWLYRWFAEPAKAHVVA